MKQPLHFMLDLETLSTSPDAHILQLALVGFDPNTGSVKEHRTWNAMFGGLEPQLGAHHSFSTWAWHMKTAPDQFKKYFDQHRTYDNFRDILEDIWGVFKNLREKESPFVVWCTGTFDIDILNAACRRLGLGTPIRYHEGRDVRTVRMLADAFELHDRNNEDVTHDAYEDCMRQIGYVTSVYRGLNERRTTNAVGAAG